MPIFLNFNPTNDNISYRKTLKKIFKIYSRRIRTPLSVWEESNNYCNEFSSMHSHEKCIGASRLSRLCVSPVRNYHIYRKQCPSHKLPGSVKFRYVLGKCDSASGCSYYISNALHLIGLPAASIRYRVIYQLTLYKAIASCKDTILEMFYKFSFSKSNCSDKRSPQLAGAYQEARSCSEIIFSINVAKVYD